MKDRINALRIEIERHNRLYYIENKPEITDRAFDAMLSKLIELEKEYPEHADPNSPTQRLGSDLVPDRKKYPHQYPMYSIRNTYNFNELLSKFPNNTPPLGGWGVEWKYDGTAVNLQYRNGSLSRALFRGDGKQGNDITANIRTIKEIPLKLSGNNIPEYIEIRGEVYVCKSDFKREVKKGIQAKTPRSYASGSLQLQSSAECAKRKLHFAAYNVVIEGEEYSWVDLAIDGNSFILNFPRVECVNLSVPNLDFRIKGTINDIRKSDIPCDGLVIKPRTDARQCVSKYHPSWLAYKFDIPTAETTLIGIAWSVANSGVVTPVAVYKPISLGGIETWKCTLHNAEKLESLQLSPGCQITIELAGTAVPNITEVNQSFSNSVFQSITNCPVCNSPLIRKGPKLICPNHQPATTSQQPAATYAHELDSAFYNSRFELLQVIAGQLGIQVTRSKKNSPTAIISYNSRNQLADLCYTLGTLL